MSSEQPPRLRHRTWPIQDGEAQVWFEVHNKQMMIHVSSPQGSAAAAYVPCDREGCVAEAIAPQRKCLEHADDSALSTHLAAVSRGVERLAARGARITESTWRLIEGALIAAYERGVPVRLSLMGAQVNATVQFTDVALDHLEIIGAVIADLRLIGCTVKNRCDARFAIFEGRSPYFLKTKFEDVVDLSYAFGADHLAIGFVDCSLHSVVATGMSAKLTMERCECKGTINLSKATAKHLMLTNCGIDGELDLSDARLAYFRAPRLRSSCVQGVLGPVTMEYDCDLSYARFSERVVMHVKAREIRFVNTQLSAGGWIAAEGELTLDGLTSGGPLHISGPVDRPSATAVRSVRSTDVGEMTFAHLDMSTCILSRAQNLSSVKLEATVQFFRSPWPNARRRCIADEFAWRASRGGLHARRWTQDGIPRLPLRTSEIAAVYRSLRHAYETRSDQPGAADFYYGEMEMRRNTPDAGPAERIIVFIYWLISGYALRAGRVFASIVIVLLGGGYAMARWGFVYRVCFPVGVFHFARSAVPGLRPTDHDGIITPIGWGLQMGAVGLVPLLLALLLLALRNRVRR